MEPAVPVADRRVVHDFPPGPLSGIPAGTCAELFDLSALARGISFLRPEMRGMSPPFHAPHSVLFVSLLLARFYFALICHARSAGQFLYLSGCGFAVASSDETAIRRPGRCSRFWIFSQDPVPPFRPVV